MSDSALRRPGLRPPLPITTLAILGLLAWPIWQLNRWPRPKAQGLEQLMVTSSLVQSFQATPERPLPALWRDRLGASLGSRVWRLQRRTWWQFWGAHADGLPFIAFPEPAVPLAKLARGSSLSREVIEQRALRVGNLLVLAPDPLSRRMLSDQLRPRMRPVRGLRRQCLQRLESGQAVFWNPMALGEMLGLMAPLLHHFQEGCLSLSVASGNRLVWQGQTVAVDGFQAAPPAWDPPVGDLPPLEAALLMELRGSSLQPLLQGLVSRSVIREPLSGRYGLDPERLELLGKAPFRLRLRPLQQGPYQAGIELQLQLAGPQSRWQPVLDRISTTLVEQGLQQPGRPRPASSSSLPSQNPGSVGASPGLQPAAPLPESARSPATGPADRSRPAPASGAGPVQAGDRQASPQPANGGQASLQAPGLTLWTRENGDVLGGWRWQASPKGTSELVLFLASAPPPAEPLAAPARRRGTDLLQLRLRPGALVDRGLLPPQLPDLVKRASQLQMQAGSRSGRSGEAAFSQLTGQLQVGPR